jgi:hypothetical protein
VCKYRNENKAISSSSSSAAEEGMVFFQRLNFSISFSSSRLFSFSKMSSTGRARVREWREKVNERELKMSNYFTDSFAGSFLNK